ncbi:hypothetical protein TNCV_934561 [Trichonephila clavipes]|nr:hypothetical protein TNCV_934561 [Trichonephila clavipes]
MLSGLSLPQFNLGVQGGIQRDSTSVAEECQKESIKVSSRALRKRKEPDTSQQAPLFSIRAKQQGEKGHGLLWTDAFTKMSYSPTILKAAFL